jgi:hypothetical protein
MKVMRAVGFDPWALVAAGALFTKGRLPLVQREGKTLPPPPFEKNSPPVPPVTLILALTCACALASCSTTPPPCSPSNPEMVAKATECRVRVQAECKGVPDSECPAVAECDHWGEARCK